MFKGVKGYGEFWHPRSIFPNKTTIENGFGVASTNFNDKRLNFLKSTKSLDELNKIMKKMYEEYQTIYGNKQIKCNEINDKEKCLSINKCEWYKHSCRRRHSLFAFQGSKHNFTHKKQHFTTYSKPSSRNKVKHYFTNPLFKPDNGTKH